MFPEDAPVVAMVSGGGDSVALVHLLASGELGPVRVRALHVNHLLRGPESDADQAFVEDLCARLGVECRVVRYDVAAYAAERRLNLEDAGRRLRYRFAEEELDNWCAELGERPSRGRIAVGHSRDDRVETFFLRAATGSGTGALDALAPVRGRIVRPLAGCDRSEIRGWLCGVGYEWREDSSNDDVSRTRALIRNELMPVVERLNPSVRSAVERTMRLVGDDDALLSGMADAFARDFGQSIPEERVTLNADFMGTLDRTMKRRTIRSAIIRAFPDAARIESEHIDAIVAGLGDPSFARDLPFGLRAVSEYGSMVISCTHSEDPRVAPTLLSLPGSADLGRAGVIVAENTTAADRAVDPFSAVIDVAHVRGELTVDACREGERMRPLGMEGTRKLSDMLIDAKVPKRLRAATPVVRDGDRVVWLAGVRMSDDYRVTERTVNAVRLTWEPGHDHGR